MKISNYYCLSGYSLTFRKDDCFISGTKLDDIYSVYLFDESIRHLLFDIIEPIELRLRSELAYVLSNNHKSALAYMEPSVCSKNKRKDFAKHLSDHYEDVSKAIGQAFVDHNLNKYGALPIWAAVELWSFGHISSFYDTLCDEDKKEIAISFKTDISRLSGWFHNLSLVRNMCAHSSRIYNKEISAG